MIWRAFNQKIPELQIQMMELQDLCQRIDDCHSSSVVLQWKDICKYSTLMYRLKIVEQELLIYIYIYN